jgi:predicted glycoside hydrolase/deacetylase ChbG (UPF0249 family)
LKRLVVTADDAGLHPGMTLGAVAAHDAGIVTAVSVATCGRAFDHAVDLLRDRPNLDAGVHLVLVGERPLSPPREVASLLGPDGAFHSGYPAFAARYILDRLLRAHVERELRRQIEKLLATGLPVVHLNSHQHLHVLPWIFDIVLRLAGEYRIPWVRIPREPAVAFPRTPREAQILGLNYLGGQARRRLGERVAAPARTVGVLDAGRLTVERVRHALVGVSSITELVCHPGLGDAELTASYPSWGYAWDQETAALRDPGLPGLLREAGIELTSFSRVRG